ncbi:MAG: DUF6295 family protein [Candidatus Dormibacteraceae bacterium]
MCSYATEIIEVSGSGKRGDAWFDLGQAMVSYDHPVHARAEHTLNLDLLNCGLGPEARVAVELTAESARALAGAILRMLGAPLLRLPQK